MGAQSGSYATLADLPGSSSSSQTPVDPSGQVITAPSQVSFATSQVQPPSNLYVGLNDYLIVTFYSPEQTCQVLISGRLLEPDGSVKIFQQLVQVTAPASGNPVYVQLTEGFLLNVTISETITTFQRGKVFFVVQLARGSVVNPYILQSLLMNYLWTGASLQWPGSPLISPTEGPGSLEVLTFTTAAGADFTFIVPNQVRIRILSLNAALLTSAVVANRQVQLVMATGGGFDVFATDSAAAQAASTNLGYNWVPAQQRAAAVFVEAMNPLPDPAILGPNMHISSLTANLQAGDQWGTAAMQVEKWVQL